ncbi:MAG: BatD family protein, partial [Candidatus Sifarchaeia archaeon]
IGETGGAQVIYGQLGIPSDSLGLDLPMYDGCIVMVLVATYGEFLEYVFSLIGTDFFGGGNGGGGITALQTDMFSLDSIFDMLGSEFTLLVNVFLDLTEAESRGNMAEILAYMGTGNLGFTFAEVFTFRLDQSFFPPEMEITLPFSSLDIYIHQVTNFDVVSTVFDVMDSTGFAGAIDETVITDADAAAAGLLAIPDMTALVDMIEGFNAGPTFITAADYAASQFGNLTLEGPLAIAAVGYIGDQVLDTSSTQLDVFSELLGGTGTVDPLDDGLSLVMAHMPYNVNVTDYSPKNEALNLTFWDNNTNMVFWNATGLGPQSDYIVYLNASALPPMITMERTFNPRTCAVGESTTVTVTVTNDGNDPIYNVTLQDLGFGAIYTDMAPTTTPSDTWAMLGPSESQSIQYTVTFTNEGRYTFPGAVLTYDFRGYTFSKDMQNEGFTVAGDLVGLLSQAMMDGWPFTGGVIGLVALVGVYSVWGLVRSRGGSDFYQM